MKVKVSTSPAQSEFEEVDLTLTTRRGAECLIGRSSDSDLVLDSTDVSRLHAKFFARSGYYYFCDVGSRNGSILNGKLAEKDHSYILKDGDIIRIGDFVLVIEDEMPDSQQAETVVRIINPSEFSNWRQNQNESATPQELQPVNNESVSSVPAAEISQKHEEAEIVNTSEEVEQSKEIFIQPGDIVTPDNAIPSPHGTSASDVPLQATAESDASESDRIVQADDTANPEPETENVSIIEHDIKVSEHSIVQVDDTANPEPETENVSIIEHDIEVSEHSIVQAHDTASPEPETENIPSVEHEEEIAPHPQEQEREIIEAINSDRENFDLDTPSQQTEKELVLEGNSILTPHESELVAISQQTEDIPLENQESEEPEELEEQEKSSIQLAKILEEKQILLVAHQSKKSELTELVSEYKEFLSYCLTRTWQTFSDDLYKQTGLSVTQEIPPANSGGYQAINSLVNSGEIIAVIYLRDLMMAPQQGQASEEALLRICNINNVLLATNLPTAKAVLYYLKNLKD
ncbi:MAG: FHA domain-containing protein [Brasilonema angustatum HA4187-MV1]|jgi:methylglyoxal synthase/pSer/pThr/pTyr-binding forkhead associated (FHA) protein|nr:FHA domain-containing protein [Brasilonema angustatum HA4187-MV1]